MTMALALNSLKTTFGQYFAGIATGTQLAQLSLVPTKTLSPGIGAYVGSHQTPNGDITALRMLALASIRLEAANTDISNLAEAVTTAVMSVTRTQLQQAGIYQLKIQTLGELQDEVANRASQTVSFSMLYEYLVLPTDSVSLISDITLDIDLNVAMGDAQFIINTGFDAQWQQLFTVIDDPAASQFTPSNWQFDPVEVALQQTSGIRGGSLALSKNKAGTLLLLNVDAATPPVKNLLVDVDFSSASSDGVGFVFRYQDINNFYFCVLSARNNYAMLGKKIGGNFSFLELGGQANITPYQISTLHRLKLVALENQFSLYVDDNPLVSGSDAAINNVGQVGLMCHGNNNVFFYRLQLLKLLAG